MAVKLRDLEAEFMKATDAATMTRVDSLAEADGVMFLCPLCYVKNKGPVGTHSVVCWFVGKVPDTRLPIPGRWNPSGKGLDDLTFVGPGKTSVLLSGEGCKWHGHIQNGEATCL